MPQNKDLNDLQVPQPTSKDVKYTLGEIISSLLPVGGAEMFRMIFTSPLEKRRNKWMEEVSRILIDLHQKQFIDIDSLAHNEEFVSLAAEVTRAALGQHEEEKLLYLRNALANSLLNDLNFDIKFSFIKAIEQLTPRHIHVLAFVRHKLPEHPKHHQSYEEIVKELATHYFDGMHELASIFFNDLIKLNFIEKRVIDMSFLGRGKNYKPLDKYVFKSWGEKFLLFISDPQTQSEFKAN